MALARLLLLLSSSALAVTSAGAEAEYEDWWPRPAVHHGLLVTLVNVRHNCSLQMPGTKYPYEYPSGKGSSRQYVVGCGPAPDPAAVEAMRSEATARNMSRQFWQVERGCRGAEHFGGDVAKTLQSGDELCLINWRYESRLNSHNVVAPVSRGKHEVTGFLRYKQGLEADWRWQLEVEAGPWEEAAAVRLRHVSTGQYLAATDSLYPDTDWGRGLREVAGAASGPASYWRVAVSRRPRAVEAIGAGMEQEIYHEGTTETSNTTTSLDIINNTQSSMADLQLLHARELRLLARLQQDQQLMRTVTEEFAADGFSLEAVTTSDILHPIDSYNLIKRTARTWARIVARITDLGDEDTRALVLDTASTFPRWETSRHAVALGLLNIHYYYGLEAGDLVRGELHDSYRNITYHAKTRLNVGDAKLIAEVAESDEHPNIKGALQWLRLFPKLRKKYRKLAKYHDDLVNYAPLTALGSTIVVAEEPFEETVFEETEVRKLHEMEARNCPMFAGENLGGCPATCLVYNRAQDITRLCQGDTSLRPPEKDITTKCEWLHYNNPFLRLSPFKLETSNNEGNYVGILLDFMSPTEIEAMKLKAKGHMKATPYAVGKEQHEFSYKRNSKIKYVSERNDELALAVTRRMEDALAYKIYTPDYRYSSENYQLMNYGFGGLISLHVDADQDPTKFDEDIGGGRFTTAMVYLSDLDSGGFTIFPKLGLFFEPKAGNLLFWNLKRTDGTVDERMHHLGCPVLYGDKWILNKWIRWKSQMMKFKCFLPKGENFPSNLQSVAMSS